MESNRMSFAASDELSEQIESKAEDLSLSKSEIMRRAIAENLMEGK